MRRDPAHAEFLQRPADLGPWKLLLSRPVILLRRGDEQAGLIRVKLHRPAVAPQILLQHRHVLRRRVLAHEARKQQAGGVIDHLDKEDLLPTSLQPVVFPGVPLHQLSTPLPPRPPYMDLLHPFPSRPPQARLPHPFPHCLLAYPDPVLLLQVLARQRRTKATIGVLLQDTDRLLPLLVSNPPVGPAASQT